jgi:putative transposase
MKQTMTKHRRALRLREYDYSQPGMYFLTACTKDRMPLFGRIENGEMIKNEYGRTVCACWDDLPNHYAGIRLDAFVVMPNHIHGIVAVMDVEAIHESPLRHKTVPSHGAAHRRSMLLPKIIGRFKMNSGKHINRLRQTPGVAVWQRNYFEHIIRNEQSLERIREYIADNPRRWNKDTENPEGH